EEREKKQILQRIYIPIVKGTTRHPWLTLTAALLILGYTFSLVPLLKTNFIDGGGSNQFTARLSMPASTTFEEQDEAAKSMEQQILALEGVDVVQSTVGSAADGRVAFGAAASGIAFTIIADEDADIEAMQSKVLQLNAPEDSEITTSQGGGFGSSETIDIQVLASDNDLLQEAVDKVAAAMDGITDVSAVTTTLEADERVLEIIVDREKAAGYLLTETAVTGIVASQLRPSPLGTLSVEGNDVQVFIAGAEAPESIEEIRSLQIPTFQGLVQLDQIASVDEVLKPTSITSERGNRTAEVQLSTEGDDLGAISATVLERLDALELPVGVTATVGGAAADQAESFEQLGLALLAAVAIVYIVMVATFSSLIQPLLLLISIPFAATGALGLLLLTDTALGVPALIGMLMLIGIVVTNAIVLIDLVNQYRAQGYSVERSLMQGARQRLRPILMTSLATIFALTPMAFGLTGDSGFISQPLAIVVIGGLFSSTLLTLILVPTLYWLVEGRKERKKLRVERRSAKKEQRAAKKSGAPVAVAAPESQPEPSTAEANVLTLEKDEEDPIAEAMEQSFTPATGAPAPEMPWSDEDIANALAEDMKLDDESQMRWSEEASEEPPAKAASEPGMPEFLTSEMPIISSEDASLTGREKREAKKQAKREAKAQRKAARDSRHSG
ncbi:MAG: efflux RND transporter permease subunit, partial [Actinomycetota bacterium]|nr:efflux RND transporter permease subunit [Actinomycetota bacterium]